ncbi:uncharacterized protein FOMMEDRAFT_137382 [Fomitiporia mediterranea MF3/22]|uniref:uncharacterized protein n=1 Tax=Fomitiporia mediterranea (strain MF3/22) TaxID=694068 RepID=UPI000440861E|nr:uncharacterized protein FOMMEDRAFT_137382 [Fomitiporia mediterranea MF3/22]EJC98045.1 hypothetical protein FOMMEDRAFT_137382 [Fomitiporia mediterranea MF3/22]
MLVAMKAQKRPVNLVSYESTDEDEKEADVRHNGSGSSGKRKLPKVDPSLTVPSPTSDPSRHQGRIRAIPHVEGQFAAYVYVPVCLKANTPLRSLLDEVVGRSKEIEPFLVCDWQDSPNATYLLHISLTRPIYLRHHQREELRRAVKMAARAVDPFTASFSSFSVFENDEHTRVFLGVDIGAGHSMLEVLSKSIEPTLKLLHQKQFYIEPRYHASIAWSLPKVPCTPPVGCLSTYPELDEQDLSIALPVTSLASSLVSDLNSRFGKTLSSAKLGVFEVNSVCLKIGKEITTWTLRKQ